MRGGQSETALAAPSMRCARRSKRCAARWTSSRPARSGTPAECRLQPSPRRCATKAPKCFWRRSWVLQRAGAPLRGSVQLRAVAEASCRRPRTCAGGAGLLPLLDALNVRHAAGFALKLERRGREGAVFSPGRRHRSRASSSSTTSPAATPRASPTAWCCRSRRTRCAGSVRRSSQRSATRPARLPFRAAGRRRPRHGFRSAERAGLRVREARRRRVPAAA